MSLFQVCPAHCIVERLMKEKQRRCLPCKEFAQDPNGARKAFCWHSTGSRIASSAWRFSRTSRHFGYKNMFKRQQKSRQMWFTWFLDSEKLKKEFLSGYTILYGLSSSQKAPVTDKNKSLRFAGARGLWLSSIGVLRPLGFGHFALSRPGAAARRLPRGGQESEGRVGTYGTSESLVLNLENEIGYVISHLFVMKNDVNGSALVERSSQHFWITLERGVLVSEVGHINGHCLSFLMFLNLTDQFPHLSSLRLARGMRTSQTPWVFWHVSWGTLEEKFLKNELWSLAVQFQQRVA